MLLLYILLFIMLLLLLKKLIFIFPIFDNGFMPLLLFILFFVLCDVLLLLGSFFPNKIPILSCNVPLSSSSFDFSFWILILFWEFVEELFCIKLLLLLLLKILLGLKLKFCSFIFGLFLKFSSTLPVLKLLLE